MLKFIQEMGGCMYRIIRREDGKYAVKKDGAQRVSKVFNSLIEAQKYCNEKNQNLDFEKEIKQGTKRKIKKAYKKNKFKTTFILLVVFALLLVIGYFAKPYIMNFLHKHSSSNEAIHVEGDISIHFLELGNKNTGDSIYIKAGDNDILIDAGSKKSSAEAIKKYINNYVEDQKLEYVIATHRHEDHIAGFVGSAEIPGIFESYDIDTIIDFPQVKTSSKLYEEYLELRDGLVKEGTKRYSALECYNNENGASRTYELAEGIELEILYNYYYDHSAPDENETSVCLLINQGSNHYLFTGDLEEAGEKKLVEYNNLPKCKLYKAGHHGSGTSSCNELLEVIQPEIICVCCCAGNDEYSETNEKQFPTQEFIDRVAKYTDKIYVTTLGNLELLPKGKEFASMNGNIVVSCNNGNDELIVNCSNNNILLKDSEWFSKNRTWPNN